MDIKLFDYKLPIELIAKHPAEPRDSSRLLVLDRKSDEVVHEQFSNLPNYLEKDDVLVFNQSKVIKARLIGHKASGGKVEILLLRQLEADKWQALVKPLRRLDEGMEVILENSQMKAIISRIGNPSEVSFSLAGEKFFAEIDKIGHVPIPPYIKRADEGQDVSDYQTVYAKDRGSVAAPTAGLHFTDQLLSKLKDKGVEQQFITLHVGYGTFAPVKAEQIEEHKMHSEYFDLPADVAASLNKAKRSGRRIIAVGTTTCRALESCALISPPFKGGDRGRVNLLAKKGMTDIFIYPGYQFKFIDGLITNFHLPCSTLLMLVAAFYGREEILRVYEEAVKKGYRFFSYGDGMMIG